MTVQERMHAAVAHHQAGRLADAELECREILADQPDYIRALFLLGIIRKQAGEFDEAIDLLRRAVELNPDLHEAHGHLGNALVARNRLAEAIASYQKLIQLKPDSSLAHHNLGIALEKSDQFDAAIASYQRAIQLQPNLAEAHRNLGNALMKKGDASAAIAAYRQAVRLKPDYAEAFCNLANALKTDEQTDEAIVCYRRAIQINPNLADAHANLGVILKEIGQMDQAIISLQRAIQLQPDLADAHCHLGNILADKDDLEQAMICFRRAIELKPDFAQAHNNLGNALSRVDRFDEAIECYRKALELQPDFAEVHCNIGALLEQVDPTHQLAIQEYEEAIAIQADFPMAHWNLGCASLLLGNFARGWPEYEWRLKGNLFLEPQKFFRPRWDGSDLAGKRILLHVEQGLGDTIQMARYVPMVAARGGKVILGCPPPLVRLLKNLPGLTEITVTGTPLPKFDVHCPLMSLPLLFKTTLESIPAKIPYLEPDPQSAEEWSKRFPTDRTIKRIGLAWSGQPKHKNDRNRSMRLDQFAPLSAWKNTKFYTLQKGPAADQARTPPAGMELIDFTDDLRDFADTAAMVAHLDLIVTVDTSVAHLAGAMGKPVWVLLPFLPDWRWMLDREDSPWYPTMRLFRQKTRGDWAEVIDRVISGSL